MDRHAWTGIGVPEWRWLFRMNPCNVVLTWVAIHFYSLAPDPLCESCLRICSGLVIAAHKASSRSQFDTNK